MEKDPKEMVQEQEEDVVAVKVELDRDRALDRVLHCVHLRPKRGVSGKVWDEARVWDEEVVAVL